MNENNRRAWGDGCLLQQKRRATEGHMQWRDPSTSTKLIAIHLVFSLCQNAQKNDTESLRICAPALTKTFRSLYVRYYRIINCVKAT